MSSLDMHGLEMFDNIGGNLVARYPNAPGAKREGTSRDAAEEMQSQAKTLRDLVLDELRKKPATPDEVAAALGKSVLAVRPRFSELLALNKIVDTSERRRNGSGKYAVVWDIAK